MIDQETSRSKLSNKKLQSCLIGCLGLVVVSAIVLVSGYFWMATPGPQVPTGKFAGSDSLALLHVEGLKEDVGLASFLQRFIEEMQELQSQQMQSEEIPWFLRFLGSMNRDVTDGQIDDALDDMPKDLTITLETIEDQDPSWVVAVNFSRFPRLMRTGFWIGSFFVETRDFNGYPLMKIDPKRDFLVTFVEHTALWAETGDALEHVLQRLSMETRNQEYGLLDAYTIRDARWNVFGVVANRRGTLAWLLQKALSHWLKQAGALDRKALEAELAGIEFLQIGVDILDEETLEAQFRFDCYSVQEARDFREKIKFGEVLVQPFWESEGLDIELNHRVEGSSVIVNSKILNIIELIAKKIDEAEERD